MNGRPEPERVIQKKVREGQVRRRMAKRGTWKRLTRLATAFAFFACTCFVATSDFVAKSCYGDQRPDVIEIFGGAAEVSVQFAQRGWNVVQPIDLQYGYDLKDEDTRRSIVDLIESKRPRLVLIEWP